MNRQKLINLVKTHTNSFEDYPFSKKNSHEKIIWTAIKQVSNKKIIALIFEKDEKLMINLKLKPQHGELMRSRNGVYPGYHMNKTHWNTITVNKTDVSKNELINMIRESDKLTQ
jgi:predicted DNA-binding protein (MmcQ/YjbR family)